MLGWICWSDEKRPRLGRTQLAGLPLLTLYLPEGPRGEERRVRRGARLLLRRGVKRVLTPDGFAWWSILTEQGLRPVSTRALRCALTPEWVEGSLAARNIQPTHAVLRLTGAQEGGDMERTARTLCPLVRNLAVDAPGGAALAARLRREYGLPILPALAEADLTLHFQEGPVLTGARYRLKDVPLPPDCEVLPLLSALWECGRVKTEDILLEV